MVNSMEVRLTGGKINADIVKVNNTVHRIPGPNPSFVHELLSYLESAGFAESPRFLGTDEKGREVLTYIEGTVYPGSGHKLSDAQLKNTAVLIRRYHDITAGSKLAGGLEIVAHGELGPHNTVYKGSKPVGFIDWDDAAPGTRLRDFAYAVDCYVDLVNRKLSAVEQTRRVKLMSQAYGWDDVALLLQDIQADYHKALQNHVKKGNESSVKIFDSLVKWIDERTCEIVLLIDDSK
jgi:hypothetical protein